MTERDTHFFSLPDVESQIVEELNERERAEDMSDNDGSEFNELERHLWDTLILMGDKLEKATAERDEAIEQLQQVRAQKLQAVKVLVGADECCGECQDASENESQKQKGGER